MTTLHVAHAMRLQLPHACVLLRKGNAHKLGASVF